MAWRMAFPEWAAGEGAPAAVSWAVCQHCPRVRVRPRRLAKCIACVRLPSPLWPSQFVRPLEPPSLRRSSAPGLSASRGLVSRSPSVGASALRCLRGRATSPLWPGSPASQLGPDHLHSMWLPHCGRGCRLIIQAVYTFCLSLISPFLLSLWISLRFLCCLI